MNRLLIGFALWVTATLAAQISMPRVAGREGGSVAADVQFAAEGSQITGLQFDLAFDANLTVTGTLGPVGSSAGKTLSTSDLAAGKKRFLVVGLNQSAIGDGVLLSLNISVPSSAGTRQYSLSVSNVAATDKDGMSLSLSATSGAVTVGPSLPAVAAVVNGASFLSGIVDGSWISVQGSSLSTMTRQWQSFDFADGKLPTLLDSVSVAIGGLPAAVYYISPTQLNVQVPATRKTGPVSVVVTNSWGASASVSADVHRNSPCIFVFTPGGGKYPAALIVRSDSGVDYLGPAGLLGKAIASRPVRTGEILELYATGLGPTNPTVPPGQAFAGEAPIIDPIAVSIGGVNAPVAFAGITSPGLYQINVTVPNISAGLQLLVVNVNGVPSQPGVFVAVGQ